MLKGFFGCLTQAYERRLNNGASFISHGPRSLSSYSCRVYLLATQAVGKEIGAASSYGGEDCGRHHDEQGCYAFFLMLLYVLSI